MKIANLLTDQLLLFFLISVGFSASAQDKSEPHKAIANLNAKAERAPVNNFTGMVWVNMLVDTSDSLDCSVGVVTFEPGARTNWHKHPGGQVLLVTEGTGYYQVRGKSIQVLHTGDVIKCSPNVEHWHGATPTSQMTHTAITTNAEKGGPVWLQKVTDLDYSAVNEK